MNTTLIANFAIAVIEKASTRTLIRLLKKFMLDDQGLVNLLEFFEDRAKACDFARARVLLKRAVRKNETTAFFIACHTYD